MRQITILHYAEVTTPNWLLFEAAAKRRNIELLSWEPHRLQIYCADNECRPYYGGQALVPEIVLHRTVALFEGIVGPALTMWSALGSCVLNPPAAAYLSRDKLATIIALCAHGVPVVTTLGLDGSSDQPLFGLGDGRVVLKPAHGLRGHGVRAFASAGSVTGPVNRDETPRHRNQDIGNQDIDEDIGGAYCVREHFVAQPLVESGGRDIRAFVVNGECLAIMARQAKPGEFRANIALGAMAEPLSLHHPAAPIAVAATSACGLDYGGVDLIEDTNGVIRVLEVDAWAGFAGITSVTGVDVAGAIIELALARRDAR